MFYTHEQRTLRVPSTFHPPCLPPRPGLGENWTKHSLEILSREGPATLNLGYLSKGWPKQSIPMEELINRMGDTAGLQKRPWEPQVRNQPDVRKRGPFLAGSGECSCSASCTYLLWVWCLAAEGLAEYWTTVPGRHPCTNHQEQQPLEEVRTRWEMEVGQGVSDTVCFDLGHSDRLWYRDLGQRIGELRWGGAPWRFHWGWVGFAGQSKKIVGIK